MEKAWGIVLSFILLVLFSALVSSIFIWLAWNATMPQIFGLTQIDIVQGFALGLLSNSLIKLTSLKTG